jgi:chromosome segregation ATPase
MMMNNQQVNAEATIQRLREQLNEALARDSTAKAALSKSDAVILDLRSNQRQLKRQLEQLQKEKSEWNKNVQIAKIEASKLANTTDQQKQQQQMESLKAQIQELTQKLQDRERQISTMADRSSDAVSLSKDAKVGELQVQLDRAHAQILTADMVRKELEDTLEAEQYTWELRVQDQEREIVSLQKECETLAQDLDQCRAQWKEAERGWNADLEDLKEQLAVAQKRLRSTGSDAGGSHADGTTPNSQSLMQKIHQLETERAELQSCLDEALKELEAVDAELQTEDGSKHNSNKADQKTVESLQHLLRWIYQEGPIEKRLNASELSTQNNAKELISQIQASLEEWLDATAPSQQNQNRSIKVGNETADDHVTIEELQGQIKVYQDELKNREESSSELRESLKEAVALLKPLQDAVAQAEGEKAELQQQLKDIETDRQSSQEEVSQQAKRIESLEEHVSSLEEQLEEQKRLSRARGSLLDAAAATPSPHKSRSGPESPPGSEDSLAKIKRAREELRRKRETEGNLQQLLKDAQSRFKNLHEQNENVAAKNRELQGQIEKLGIDDASQSKEAALAATLAQREAELRSMREQLERMQQTMEDPSSPNSSFQKAQELEEALTKARGQLAQREHAERVLNKSLKEALGLLKPLQMHLEEAEAEKMEISKELRNLRKRFRQLQMGEGDDISRSTMGGHHPDISVELIKMKDELEETVRQLELENSQLHDALEDLTEDGSNNRHIEAKLRQRLVELNSRYEVTQNKLEDAHVENHALVKALKQREAEEMKRKNELIQLQERLQKTETELHNAKAIAKSALVKVEELTMSSIEHLSRDGHSTSNSTMDGHHHHPPHISAGDPLQGFSF